MSETQPPGAVLPPARAELERLMAATLADHANWRYAAVRPMPIPHTWSPGQHVRADCSSGVRMLCCWAKLPDPMMDGYSQWGNSSTLAIRLQHADRPSDLQVGDIVTFGVAGSEHAAMVLIPGDDPTLWSHGHQGAPNTYPLSADRRPAQYLKLPIPDYVPTADDRLRARTGWFAWTAWRLGEGDWRDHGKTNQAVRPNVPRLIPPAWWARYARFVTARKKP